MINERQLKKYCSEDISKIENYEQAVNDKTQVWDCHHRAETDKNMSKKALISKGLYCKRPASELIFLTKRDHRRLHGIGRNLSGEQHPFFWETPLKGNTEKDVYGTERETPLRGNEEKVIPVTERRKEPRVRNTMVEQWHYQ